jgi:DNA-binding transcriptional LysR family regulator
MDRLSELQIFVEVIERGDYSAAARSLDLTPSAVSKAVKRLETRLGARLLERTSRTMRPTVEGDIFYGSAKRAVEAVNEAEASVSGALAAPAGDLRVHVPPTFAIYQLARIVPEFRERHPGIRLAFILRNEPLDMAEHRIDVTITVGRPPDSDLLVRKIGTSRWVICAAPAYLQRRGAPLTLDDLPGHDWLGYTLENPRNSGFQSEASEGLVLAGSSVAANNGSMLQALARVGAGIVRLADYHVAADIEAGRLVRLFPDAPEERQDVFAVYPRKLRGSARVRAFVDFIQEKFSSPSWGA